ncbi:hypothetical protein FZZ93_04160 [Halomonas eurihalina]|uniref:Uncharacterized protein n=1 Tax=Halomonas eurihalina TaxID=42566 RepID=A0A5D9D9U3_HALER|nr:hypothetical protein [Halomonas eurihalina]MDR5858480.1 hypothetical protein [Halomonas eurihalina]TZG40674.1 hypothetical protein FZZ93_04160 [Halomonas eurihalina]
MSKKIFIHCGMHKTGSSSIQHSLYNSRNDLIKYGWDFISDNPSGNCSRHISVWRENGEVRTKFQSRFFELLESSQSDYTIISAEHLSVISSEGEIRKLKKEVEKNYAEVEVIFYLRRQDKLAISFKAQASKMLSIGKLP